MRPKFEKAEEVENPTLGMTVDFQRPSIVEEEDV